MLVTEQFFLFGHCKARLATGVPEPHLTAGGTGEGPELPQGSLLTNPVVRYPAARLNNESADQPVMWM